jgi:hypothetical protein
LRALQVGQLMVVTITRVEPGPAVVALHPRSAARRRVGTHPRHHAKDVRQAVNRDH